MTTVCCTPLLTVPLPRTDAEDLAARFGALAEPARLRMLSLISARGDVCGCELVEPLGLSQPTVSHHLKVLFEAGLLAKERRGRWIHYSVDPEAVEGLRDALVQ
jgi:ArsR family transcriptional regulator